MIDPSKEELFYSGIGSRETPAEVLEQMTAFAQLLDRNGYILRSGGAEGADTAFAAGTERKHIYRPQHASEKALQIAEQYHPNWKACNAYARRLHARNVLIVLGPTFEVPSKFIICWTRNGKAVGGTGQALRIAEAYGIPVINLGA